MAKENQLNARKVATIKEPGYHLDGRGLYLQVSKGKEGINKSWVLRYKFAGRVREMGLGPVADLSLGDARKKAADYRNQVRDGIDPIAERKAERAAKAAQEAKRITFEEAAKRYIAAHEKGWSEKSRDQWCQSLAKHCKPIHRLSVDQIELPHILKVLEPIWHERTVTASRLRGRIERILAWATVRKYREGDNPARWSNFLSETLVAPHKVAKKKPMPSLPFKQVPEFMEWLREREDIASRALEFLILTGVRVSNVRLALWSEIELDGQVWEIPGESTEDGGNRMKMGVAHRVPLVDRAIEILAALPRVEGNDQVFPGARRGGALGPDACNRVAKNSGHVDPKQGDRPITAHGFRSTFRTWGAETTNYPREVLERALAHDIRTEVEAAYERGDLFEKRRRVMEAWARYCQSPPAEAKGKVVPLHGASA